MYPKVQHPCKASCTPLPSSQWAILLHVHKESKDMRKEVTRMLPDSSIWNLNQACQGAQCAGMPRSSCPSWGTGDQTLVIRTVFPRLMALTQVGTKSSRAIGNFRWGLVHASYT